MKLTHVIAATLLPLHLFAQDSLRKKNEIGLYAEGYRASYMEGHSLSTLGLTYKHHKNEFLALVLTAGQTNYRVEPWQTSQPIAFDTLTWRNIHTHASMFTIGAAVEAQRKFYKRFSLYAGAELRVAYGTGNYDTVMITRYKVPNPHPIPGGPTQMIDASTKTLPGPDISITQTSILPYIGIKANFGRFNAGYMLSGYLFKFQNISTNVTSYGTFDLEIGNLSKRFFITYRF